MANAVQAGLLLPDSHPGTGEQAGLGGERDNGPPEVARPQPHQTAPWESRVPGTPALTGKASFGGAAMPGWHLWGLRSRGRIQVRPQRPLPLPGAQGLCHGHRGHGGACHCALGSAESHVSSHPRHWRERRPSPGSGRQAPGLAVDRRSPAARHLRPSRIPGSRTQHTAGSRAQPRHTGWMSLSPRAPRSGSLVRLAF